MVPKKPTRTPNNKNSALTRKTPRRASFILKLSLLLLNNALTKLLVLKLKMLTAVNQMSANNKLERKLYALPNSDHAESILTSKPPMLKILRLAWLTAKTKMVRPLLNANSLLPPPKLRKLKRTSNAHASLVPKDSLPELLSSPPLTSWPETSLESLLQRCLSCNRKQLKFN